MSRNRIVRSISKHTQDVPIVRLVGLKIAHLSCALYVIYLVSLEGDKLFSASSPKNKQMNKCY